MRFLATINIPGYLPMDDEPPTFETAQEAWEYLAGERERGEENTEGEEWTDTYHALASLAEEANWRGSAPTGWLVSNGLTPVGTGTIYGGTPGSDSPYDLGLAYSVSVVEEPQGVMTCFTCAFSMEGSRDDRDAAHLKHDGAHEPSWYDTDGNLER